MDNSAQATSFPDVSEDTQPARLPRLWRMLGTSAVLIALVVGSFELVYYGKVYPGVMADGVNLGGLTRDAATTRLAEKTKDFTVHAIALKADSQTVTIPVKSLNVTYDTKRTLDAAYNYGRSGGFGKRLAQQARALGGHATAFANYKYDDAALQPFLNQAADAVVTPVADAVLVFEDNSPRVRPSSVGRRLDLGQAVQAIDSRIGTTDTTPVLAPTYGVNPAVTTADLNATAAQASIYLAAPIQLTYGAGSREITQATIASWIKVRQAPERDFLITRRLEDLYRPPANMTLGLDPTAVKTYVTDLATKTDQAPKSAALAMQDGQLVVIKPSQDGIKLDQAAAVTAITTALGKSTATRDLALKVDLTKADVREDNLAALGIKEQLSQGISFFPGSSKDRLTNVRAGAARFNNVVLKPGEVFSFGKLLGDVNASTGYVPELVILADHEEKQYGGGLCQVSSTAFRAALNAGLPIKERYNHSFAISFYTNPYGVPGVDATIYYPQIDFKFQNDTPGYLLIQTTMEGTTLKFDYFGTKTKTGTIRGPQFITGDADTTKPSKTVFYRDIMDMTGKVTKTDTFYTNYQSSLKFPVQKEFN